MKNRMQFLKEKMKRNIEEVKNLAKLLLSYNIFSKNRIPSLKTKYFNILKVKKIREDSHFEKVCKSKNDTIDSGNNEFQNEYDNFLHYNCPSDSENDSIGEDMKSNHKENEIFNSVFNTKFVSLNQSREEDEEFIDLTNNIANNLNDNMISSFISCEKTPQSEFNQKTINSSQMNEVNKSIFTDDELKDFSKIFDQLKNLYTCDSQKIFDSCDNSVNYSKQKRYNILTLEQKKKLVELSKQSNAKVISKKFGVPLKSLKRWLLLGVERKKGAGRKEKDPEMESLLYEWYNEFHVNKKNYITSKVLKNKALELSNYKDFVASKDWLNKFKRKYNVEIIKEADLNLLIK